MKLRAGHALLMGNWVVASCLVASPVAAQTEPVHITYRAPEICPSREEFLVRVRSRSQRAAFAAADELARSFDVRVVRLQNQNELLGQLEFVDRDGRRAVRSLGGSACDQLASSLALITALAIDDRITEAPLDELSPPPSPSPAPPSAPTPPTESAERAAPARLPEPVSSAANAKRVHWEFGGNLGALTWITRSAAPIFGVYAELGSSSTGWSVRLSVIDSRRSIGDGERSMLSCASSARAGRLLGPGSSARRPTIKFFLPPSTGTAIFTFRERPLARSKAPNRRRRLIGTLSCVSTIRAARRCGLGRSGLQAWKFLRR